MIAVDTNLIIRYLTNDHPKQSAKAKNLIDGEDFFIATTVLLETEWVLRKLYGLSPESLLKALYGLAGLPLARLEDPGIIRQALEWLENGMDFADALHLAKAAACDAFVTFDKELGKAAAKLDISGVKVL